MPADFLALPERRKKPRQSGITHVLDKGMPAPSVRALLEGAGDFIDVWKFGWGTAYLDRELEEKLAILAQHDIRACIGGTLLEISWSQGKVEQCLRWAANAGMPLVEVSCGVMPIPPNDKARLIKRAAETFTVLTEVGSKNPARRHTAEEWARDVEADLAAGAWLVITEGRESGTVGMYGAGGEVLDDLIEAVASVAGHERILFEAPRTDQQGWLVNRFGCNVNLGNIALTDVVGVEALRLGLRADTAQIPTIVPSW